ncbi:MAG: bifunctional phosphoglucose/phosphomannose isomerase [Actinomycetota bacterium]|nr:bifunctional phosphoglucose/phosphomannose isomerase [Actinomycetota bacterium]
MIDLDDLTAIATVDQTDYISVVESWPQQLVEGMQIGASLQGLPSPDGIDSIAVLGMGGSGVSGDILGDAIADVTRLRVQTIKGYVLPGWVGENTLVFAISYSGDTEETLAAFEQAQGRGCRIVSVTTGGRLLDESSRLGIPVASVPGGLMPRAATGYLSSPLLMITERLGLAQGLSDAIHESIELLQKRVGEYGRTIGKSSNLAKRLAESMLGMVPIIYGSQGIAETAAYRWKCQFNECSKVPSFHHSFPELDHNEIVGWDQLKQLTKSFSLIVLRHEAEHPRVTKRIEITNDLIGSRLGAVHQVRAHGSSNLARLFDFICLGDFVSAYLAVLQGVDPAPITVLQDLKKRMAAEAW